MSDVDNWEVLVRLAPHTLVDRDGLASAWERVDADRGAARVAPALRRRPSPRIWWLSAAACVIAVVAAVVWPGTHEAAFASWTPVPSVPSADQARQAFDACADAAGGLGLTADGTLTDVLLAEQRGSFTFEMVASGSNGVACLSSGDSIGLAYALAGVDGSASAPRSSFTVATYLALTTSGSPDAGPVSIALGSVPVSATQVQIVLSDGSKVEASVSHGWWAAWWPKGMDPAATATWLTSDGAHGESVPLTAPLESAQPGIDIEKGSSRS